MASLPKPRPASGTAFASQEPPAPSTFPAVPRERQSPWYVRPALVVALAASIALHLAWSLWPVDFTPTAVPEEPPLTADLREIPPPPPPAPPPKPAPAPVAKASPPKPHVAPQRRPAPRKPVIATQAPTAAPPAPAPAPVAESAEGPVTTAAAPSEAASPLADVVIGPPADAAPPVVLPPRLDLVYGVYFGTQGFMIGNATYRFEHDGDRYRISTVVEPNGLAALFVHGRGLVESRGIITPQGLKPYEFAIERGSADKREVAYFNWDSMDVILDGGKVDTLEPPAFDPLTIMWQPYFSPPSREDQAFTLATTRRVARYTLSLEGEEMLPWRQGEVLTQRWHEVSADGKGEGWFWLAPSLHYIPIKMRVARTKRGTLEAKLHAIRTDANGNTVSEEEVQAQKNPPFRVSDPRQPDPGGPESHGQ
jgi:hypothetical protein